MKKLLLFTLLIGSGSLVHGAASGGIVQSIKELTSAILSNDITQVIQVLDSPGVDASENDELGYTPLHHAVAGSYCPNPEIVRLLLDRGADVFARNRGGKTPYQSCQQFQVTYARSISASGGQGNFAEIEGMLTRKMQQVEEQAAADGSKPAEE